MLKNVSGEFLNSSIINRDLITSHTQLRLHGCCPLRERFVHWYCWRILLIASSCEYSLIVVYFVWFYLQRFLPEDEWLGCVLQCQSSDDNQTFLWQNESLILFCWWEEAHLNQSIKWFLTKGVSFIVVHFSMISFMKYYNLMLQVKKVKKC